MKLKYYMRGLGVGIIVTTLVLSLLYAYRMSDARVIKRAEELGMVKASQNSDDNASDDKATEKVTEEATEETTGEATEKATEKATEEATKETTEKAAEEVTEEVTEKVTEKATEKSTEKSTEKVTEKATEKVTEKATEKVTEKATETATQAASPVTVEVSAGMYSEKVCSALYALGLIDDENGFNEYLENNGYSERIKTGTHYITPGSSYEEIAKALCK